MKALPLEQRQLLDLQKVDLAIARIEHQERTHPALATLDALRGRQGDLRGAIIATQADLDALQRQIEQAEGEVAKVRARRSLQQGRLDGGKVPMRDMSAMEHEIASMDTRIETLEGSILELMESAEKLQAGIAAAEANAAAIAADEESARADMGADLAVSAAKRAELERDREGIRSRISEPVLALYDRLQGRLGTLVVIEVHGGHPVGSPVEFSMAELQELNALPMDELYISDETEYIIARTAE